MALGIGAYVVSALATAYGTRIIFLSTTVIELASCCWAAAAGSYRSLLIARIFQGQSFCLTALVEFTLMLMT
jgi:predicted MFS family arabinose efflux permease